MKHIPLFRLAGALLVLLGGTVIVGWCLHIASVVRVLPGFTPMVFNTALCFVLAGGALLTPFSDKVRYQQVTTLIGSVLASVAALILTEHVLQLNLGIDWPSLHVWLNDANPVPGRMSVPTASSFLLSGLTLVMAARVRRPWMGVVVRSTTLSVGVIGVFGLVGYFVHAHLLFPAYPFVGVAVHTAAGFLLLSIGLWSAWRRFEWAQVPLFSREEDRVTFLGATILALVAVTSAILSFAILQDQVQTLVGNNLLASLTRRTETLQDFIQLREGNARIAATRPAVLRNLRVIQAGRDDGSNLANVKAVVDSFVQQGFGGVTYFDVDGKAIASGGVFVQNPAVATTLATADKPELLWDNRFVLRHHLQLRDTAGVVGSVLVEQPLPVLARLMRETPRIAGDSAEVGLCFERDQQMDCFPTRQNPRGFSVPQENSSGLPLPMTLALRGQTGVVVTRDYREQNVIAAHGPAGDLGMGMVVKVDAAEVLKPVREQLQLVFVVLALFVGGGSLLLRSQIKPLVAQIIRSATALRENQEQFQTVVSGIKDYAIIMLDAGGHIVSWNAGAEHIKGYREHEIIGQHFSRFYPQDDVERGKPDMELKTVMAEGRYEEDGWRVRKDGSLFWANVVITALHDESGKLRGFLKIARDITERNRFELALRDKNIELERASRAKDIFLASMSHELRTPLNAIIGFTGTLLMKLPGPIVPEQEKQLRTVQTSARHLLSLINDLLDMAKIDADKFEMEPEDVDCNSLVEELVDFLRLEAKKKGLTLTVELPAEALILRTDRRALSQIFINLAGNAIKFTDSGGVRVWLEKNTTAGRNTLKLSVEDTGPGIREQDQVRLFEAFSRVQATDRRKLEGTGLGLHLSRKLAEKLGGSITFHSEYGRGSTFTLELPEI